MGGEFEGQLIIHHASPLVQGPCNGCCSVPSLLVYSIHSAAIVHKIRGLGKYSPFKTKGYMVQRQYIPQGTTIGRLKTRVFISNLV